MNSRQRNKESGRLTELGEKSQEKWKLIIRKQLMGFFQVPEVLCLLVRVDSPRDKEKNEFLQLNATPHCQGKTVVL